MKVGWSLFENFLIRKSDEGMNINIRPKEIVKANLYLVLFLLCANLFGIVAKYYFDHDHVYGLVRLFNFDTEKNVPTFYSAVALLVSGVLLSLIASNSKKTGSPYVLWYGLSFIFLFLSVDEISSIHEHLTVQVRDKFGASGFLYYAWVIPYGVALCVFIIAYSKFLFELPIKTMLLFLISGSLFVSGAIGFELLGGRHAELYGTSNITYAIITTCEELLEMLGIAIFIYTLLTYIVRENEALRLTINNDL